MRNLDFTYLSAENFLCFKNKVEIDLRKLGRIVVVKGVNLDATQGDPDATGEPESNGAGKSSIPEIISYGLFGKTIRRPKKLGVDDVVNFQTGKKMAVEVRWDKYRVVRKKNPDSLKLYELIDGHWKDETRGKKTQQYIEETLLGMNYETFVNVSVFSDDNTTSFLEVDTPTKRKIVENLLSLEKYCGYFDNAKKLRNAAKASIKTLTTDFSRMLTDVDQARFRLEQVKAQELNWRHAQKQEAHKLALQAKAKEDEIAAADFTGELAAYQMAQGQLAEAEAEGKRLAEERASVEQVVAAYEANLKEAQATLEKRQVQKAKKAAEVEGCKVRLAQAEATVMNINDKQDTVSCPWCYQDVPDGNYDHVLDEAKKVIDAETRALTELNVALAQEIGKLDKTSELVGKVRTMISQKRSALAECDRQIAANNKEVSRLSHIKEPQPDAAVVALQQQLESLRSQEAAKLIEADGVSPYEGTITALAQELSEKEEATAAKKAELKEAEDELPYLEFWVKGFGDDGIRQHVIAGIVPAMNKRISYCLQFLVNGKLSLAFDPSLEATIDRWPFLKRPYVYHGLSGGQKQHLNIALSQSIAHVQLLNTGTCPSFLWLDEVTSNISRAGIEGVYRMLCEMSKERQVFVIDHNEALLQKLAGCQTITVTMKDEASTISIT